ECPIWQAVWLTVTLCRWNIWNGTHGHDEPVIIIGLSVCRVHAAFDAVDASCGLGTHDDDAMFMEERFVRQRNIWFAIKAFTQPDPVVGQIRFFTEYGDVKGRMLANQFFKQALSHHAMADNDQAGRRWHGVSGKFMDFHTDSFAIMDALLAIRALCRRSVGRRRLSWLL